MFLDTAITSGVLCICIYSVIYRALQMAGSYNQACFILQKLKDDKEELKLEEGQRAVVSKGIKDCLMEMEKAMVPPLRVRQPGARLYSPPGFGRGGATTGTRSRRQ